MANAGLSFANPFLNKVGVGEEPNPYAPFSPTSSIGLGGLGPSAADLAVAGKALTSQSQFTMPKMRRPPDIAFSPTRNEFFVQGVTFPADDAPAALQAEKLLSGPGTGLPTEGDWQPLDVAAYQQYLQSIRQPSLGRLASKNFGIGVDSMQELAGRALQALGAEEIGGRIVAQQKEDLARTVPFERQFTDIKSGQDAVEWFVANFAQQGPNMIEAVAAGGLGFLAGASASGAAVGAGGALAGLIGKTAFKEAVTAAARKKAAGEVLNAAENKLLREAAGLAGAVATTYVNNLAIGTGDIYGELRDQGANADDVDARLKALAGSVPYAALESLPEFLLASRIFGNTLARKALPAGTSFPRRSAELLRRGAAGFGVGGVAEGTTELGQEGLLLGLSGQDFSAPENVDRLINSFAAGFGIGGPIGAAANLRSKKPENLLNPSQPPEPAPKGRIVKPLDISSWYTPPNEPGTQGVLPIFGKEAVSVKELRQRMSPNQQAVTAPQQAVQPPFVDPRQGVLDLGLPPVQGVLNIFDEPLPPQELAALAQPFVAPQPQTQTPAPVAVSHPGQGVLDLGLPPVQGVLNIFDEPLPPQELAARAQPSVAPQPQTQAPASVVNPGQGALQFSTPQQAPFNTQMADQLRQLQLRQQRQREFEAAQAQQSAAIQQQIDALAQQSQNAQPVQFPMRQVGPTQPMQLPLFSRRQAPIPSRAEGLRRGVGTLLPMANVTEAPQTTTRQPVQRSLFTKKGQVTVDALRAAGVEVKPQAKGKAKLQAKGKAKPQPKVQAKGKAKLQAKGKAKPQAKEKAKPQAKGKAKLQAKEKAKPQAKGKAKLQAKEKAKPQAEEKQQPLTDHGMAEAGRQWAEYADPDTQPQWSELSPAQQEAWRKVAIDERKPNIAATEEIAPPIVEQAPTRAEVEQTPAEVLEEKIFTAETTTSIRAFKDAIQTVLNYAFFEGEDTNVKKLVDRAREFLSTTEFSDTQMAAMDNAFLDAVQFVGQLEAVYKGGSNKGKLKPWFTHAVARNLLPRIKIKITNLPKEYRTQTQKVQEQSIDQIVSSPEALLGDLINELITHVSEYSRLNQRVTFQGKSYAGIVALAKELYAKVSKQGRNYIVRGHELREYFKDDGSPKMIKSDGRYLISTTEVTTAQQRALEQAQKDEAKALAEAERDRARMEKEGFRDEDAWDDTDGRFYRDDGTEVKGTLPVGLVRLLVKSFLGKLHVKPTVSIYANVADLKQRNPDLYARAAAARKEGDFDTTNAAGYSFGSNIIIFTDFVRTEQQLKFILAHETLGHFGFKGIVPKAKLKEVLNRIYEIDPNVRAAVDAMVTNRGMSKLEAIEEYLSDSAADLDNSTIVRIWSVLKDILNKLGFKFEDDVARYFVNLARKYVRQGDTGNFANAHTIASRLEALYRDQTANYHSTSDHDQIFAGDMGSRLFAAGALNRRFGGTSGIYGAMDAFSKGLFGARYNVPGIVSRILEHVQTLDNKARRSYGLSQIYRLLEKQQHYARKLLSGYQRMTAFTHSASFLKNGVTEAQKERAGELLARAALLRAENATDEKIKAFGPLVFVDGMGNVIIDHDVLSEITKAGFVTAEEFRKGFDITYSDGSKVHFQYDVDENSPEWKVYLELRNAINEASIDLMLSNYEAAQAETTRVLKDLNAKRQGTNVFMAEDLAAIRRVAELYKNKRYADSGVENASVMVRRKAIKDSEEFLVAFGRALFNDDVFAVWMKDPNAKESIAKELAEFQKAEYDDIRAQLPSLRAKIKTDKQSFQVQKAVRDMFLFDLQSKNADYYAKRTILGSYVPFTRRGSEQVKLVAVNARGKTVALSENVRSALPYFQFNSRKDALETAKELDEEFGNGKEFILLNDDGDEVTVHLKAEVSRARQSPDLTEAVNFNEFVYVLNRLNINITPEARERVVTTLTAQNARARHNLQRSGTEGWDKDVVRSVSEFLETTAHVAAKKLFRHRLDDILVNSDNWLGDDNKLADLKAAIANAQTDGERARAQRAYDEYAYMYRYMKGTAGDSTVTIDGKEVPTLGRGEDYRKEARQVLRWYSEATNISDSTEDLLSGETGSVLKLATVLLQLGGSVATAAVNLTSLVTHSLPYLSFYNRARGFGGGYGEAKSATALWRATRDVKSHRMADAAFLDQMLREGTYGRYRLTEDEAKFLFTQTEEGTLQAAQFNALVGTARGKVFNNKAQAVVQGWMYMFSYTEQLNRRATALAAYRLEKERLRAQGVVDEQQLADEAAEAARTAVNFSQGEYAMFNRPEMARGNVLQYIFMYKQFPIITVQLLRALPVQGQIFMLSILLLASGLKGLPFADDIFDIVDTIAQKLGLKMPSIERELARWIDAIAPGMTPFAMRGVVDRMTGATMSTRLGMGDLAPLSGAFKAGANPAREIADFAGPVFSGISGLVGTAGSFARYGAEVIGLRDDVTTIRGILRNSPSAAFRAFADGAAYLSSGTITNNRGQVVTKEAPYHVVLTRMLGFYPAIATEQNDIVRLSKNVADYAKAIKAEHVSAYVKAKLDGDTTRMQEIANAVRDWNADAKGTGLEISTFLRSANRAALEASRPTALRYLKSAPKQMRPETLELLRLNGLEDEIR